MAGITAPSHNSSGSGGAGEENILDRFLDWIRSLFDDDDGAPSTDDNPPTPEEGAVDCNRLAQYVAAYGATPGRAIFAREIQHEGGRQGFRTGGWMGAIVGGISGTGAGISAIQECERQMGAQLSDLADSRQSNREIRDERRSCKDECDATFTNHNLITANGKPWRECRKNCREEAHDARVDRRGGLPTQGSAWFRSFMP